MRRSRSVCILAFTLTLVTVVVLFGFMLFLVAIRKPESVVEVPQSLLKPEEKDPDAQNDLVDHRSHSKPGVYYSAIDVLGSNKVVVNLNGQRSHTHFHDVGPPSVVGKLVSYVWFDNETHTVLGTNVSISHTFKVGIHTIGLTVADNTRDTHTAYTTVEVMDSLFDGAYCYYYPVSGKRVAPKIRDGERPSLAVRYDNLTFASRADFPALFRNQKIRSRCVFHAKDENFNIRVSATGNTRLFCNGNDKPVASSNENGVTVYRYVKPTNNNLDRSCHLLYDSITPRNPRLVVQNIDDLQHDFAKVIPVISSIEPADSTFDGGGKALITGIALNTDVTVYFGDGLKAKCDILKGEEEEEGTKMTCIVPKNPANTDFAVVGVRAENRNGRSNSIKFEYTSAGALPVKFKEKKVDLGAYATFFDLITGIRYGPDHHYYLTSMNSHVVSFKLTPQLKVAQKPCKSPSLGSHRRLFGLAFNPRNGRHWLYVSSSVIFWRKNTLLTGELSWANGQIHVLKKGTTNSGPGCLVELDNSPIIEGLPVSNHDHGVNGLVFDNQGRLHILVGGFTNAGQIEDTKLGGVGENPLSAASLMAEVEKPGFNGKITYNPKQPEIAIKRSGDVRVFMAGLRNPFGINLHSNGKLYATDNGPSQGYGGKSLDCNHEQDFEDSEERYMVDKLVLLRDGKYAGHPNRNRGRNEKKPYECVFHSVLERKRVRGSEYEPPLATLESSTNGVLEYMSNAFNGEMKGDLLLSMYATDKSEGTVWRVGLNKDGTAVEKQPLRLLPRSGLSMELTPNGGLIMARVFRQDPTQRLIAYEPDVKSKRPTLVSVMPNRGSPKGGYWILVTVRNIGNNPTAIFGDVSRACKGSDVKDVKVVDMREGLKSFMCRVPPYGGLESAGFPVTISHFKDGHRTTTKPKGIDFVYTNA